MNAAVPVLLAAAGGGLVAVALREWIAVLPSISRQLESGFSVLTLAGRENRVPTEAERRRLGLIAGGALAVLAVVVTGSLPLAGIAAAGPAAAGWAVARRRRNYRLAVECDIAVIAGAIADAVAAGGSLRVALPAVASGLRGPSAVEFARVCSDLDVGVAPHRALAGLSERIGSDRVGALVTAILSQQRAGGDLAGLLRRHGAAAAQRERAEREARSATAQARMTGGLVVAMPVVMALLVELISPGFAAGLLAEPAAAVLLAVAGALQVAGFLAIRKLGEVRR
ncbi:MAG: type II secretion system F family protein [Solirubrobacterales bacterium]